MINSRGSALASLFVVAGGFAFGVASAQTSASPPASPVDLTWNAPPGCSDSLAILKEVGALRGDHAAAEQMKAVANLSLDANGVWNLQITTTFADGTHGERQIQAESCKAAAEATASILALAITTRAQEIAAAPSSVVADRDASASSTSEHADASAPPPTTTASADAGALPEAPTPPAPQSAASKIPFHPYVGGNLGGSLGDFPSLGFGGGGDLGVMLGVFRGEAYANYWALGRASFSTGGHANFQMFSAGLRTCLSFGDSFSLGPCAAFEVGSLASESVGVTSPSSGSALMADGFLGALGTLSLDKNRLISLRALIEVGGTFQRPTFVLDGAGFSYQPGPLVGRGTFGAELRF